MTFWFSPFPLSAALEAHLRAAGMQPYLESSGLLPANALILYPPPHALLGLDGADADPQAWLAGYAQALELASQHRCVALGRLQALAPEAISTWLRDGGGNPPPDLPAMEPLQALITRELLHAYPQLLEAYLDLELQAELLGGAADSHYLERLRAACTAEALLKAAGTEREKLAEQVKDAQEEAELTLLQLHQVQEELEQVFLSSQEQQKELVASREELSKANQACEQLRAELKEGGTEREKLAEQVKDAQEEAELTLVQLHQVQEELEHYFLLSRDQQTMIERQNKLSSEALALAAAAC